MKYDMQKIINVATELARSGKTAASTSERIAAAFVLDRMEFLPEGYSVIDAWERLDCWQHMVKIIRRDHYHELDI